MIHRKNRAHERFQPDWRSTICNGKRSAPVGLSAFSPRYFVKIERGSRRAESTSAGAYLRPTKDVPAALRAVGINECVTVKVMTTVPVRGPSC